MTIEKLIGTQYAEQLQKLSTEDKHLVEVLSAHLIDEVYINRKEPVIGWYKERLKGSLHELLNKNHDK